MPVRTDTHASSGSLRRPTATPRAVAVLRPVALVLWAGTAGGTSLLTSDLLSYCPAVCGLEGNTLDNPIVVRMRTCAWPRPQPGFARYAPGMLRPPGAASSRR